MAELDLAVHYADFLSSLFKVSVDGEGSGEGAWRELWGRVIDILVSFNGTILSGIGNEKIKGISLQSVLSQVRTFFLPDQYK